MATFRNRKLERMHESAQNAATLFWDDITPHHRTAEYAKQIASQMPDALRMTPEEYEALKHIIHILDYCQD